MKKAARLALIFELLFVPSLGVSSSGTLVLERQVTGPI